MKILTSTAKLNFTGITGVILFLLPAPICWFIQWQMVSNYEAGLRSARIEVEIGMKPIIPTLQSIPLEMLAIASFVSMVGLVLIIIGRDIITKYPD